MGQVNLNTQPAAACLALIAKHSSAHKKLLDSFIQLLNSGDVARIPVGALCLGEYGKLSDLSANAQVFNQITSLFGNSNEQVR